MSLLAGYFTAVPSWAYFNGEPSSGLLHSGAFLAYFNGEPSSGLLHSSVFLAYLDGEPSNGLLHSVPSWPILMMNILTGFFTVCLLGLF